MALTVTELADEVRQTNQRLAASIDSLRAEIGTLNVKVGEVNASLGWIKVIGGTLVGFVATLSSLTYQGAGKVSSMDASLSAMQKSNEELRADLKAHGKAIAEAVEASRRATEEARKASEEARKASEDVRLAIKAQSADMTRIQESLDKINDGLGRVIIRPRQP